jgi:hypothetical protein
MSKKNVPPVLPPTTEDSSVGEEAKDAPKPIPMELDDDATQTEQDAWFENQPSDEEGVDEADTFDGLLDRPRGPERIGGLDDKQRELLEVALGDDEAMPVEGEDTPLEEEADRSSQGVVFALLLGIAMSTLLCLVAAIGLLSTRGDDLLALLEPSPAPVVVLEAEPFSCYETGAINMYIGIKGAQTVQIVGAKNVDGVCHANGNIVDRRCLNDADHAVGTCPRLIRVK